MTHEFHLSHPNSPRLTTVQVKLEDDFPAVVGIKPELIGARLEFMLRRIGVGAGGGQTPQSL